MAAPLSSLVWRVGASAAHLKHKRTSAQYVRSPSFEVTASCFPPSSGVCGSSTWGGSSRGRACISSPRSRRGLVSHMPSKELIVSSSAGDAAAGAPSTSDDSSSIAGAAGGSPNFIAGFIRGLRLRMAADPNFPFKLGAEVCLDEFMTLAVNIGVRGNPLEWALAAKLQVVCQMLTAAINDLILVYCLAPVKEDSGKEAAPKKVEIAHIFQEGDFSMGERIGCYLSKGGFYAVIGAISCTFSMALALLLSGQTAQFTPEYLFRALMTGALHMGISANTRYQIVNGIERVMYSILPQNVARISSVAARLGNNLLGARLWIVMTTLTGLA